MQKYEQVPEEVQQMYSDLQRQLFPYLANAKILLLACKKKTTKGGNLSLGRICKADDLDKYLSREEAPDDGYDFIIRLDGKLVAHAESADIERVLRHELRHIFFDPNAKVPYKLIDHDFSDFYDEVELNKDDPSWARRVARMLSLMYEQE